MLRFGKPGKNNSLRQIRLRMWLLFGMLLLVLAAFNFLQRQETIARLETAFNPRPLSPGSTQAEVNEGAFQLVSESTSQDQSTSAPLVGSEEDAPAKSPNAARPRWFAGDLSGVRDNTYFRPEEAEAWFEILAQLRTAPTEEIRRESQGLLSYVQLNAQPEVYRGQVVTITGRLMQQELLDAPANTHEFKQYYRLTIQPTGGGVWPIMVYAIDLPAALRSQVDSHPTVTVYGVFFKNWSYAWEEGLGLAPTLLAKTITSQPPEQATISAGESAAGSTQPSAIERQGNFREVLELMGYSTEDLRRLGSTGPMPEADWKLLLPLMARLQNSNFEDLELWTQPPGQAEIESQNVGQLLDVEATVTGVTSTALPAKSAALVDFAQVYRCQVQLQDSRQAVLLVPEVPTAWLSEPSLKEPVRFRGVLSSTPPDEITFVASRLAWFPVGGGNSGKDLLARFGMDAALWDNITQRTAFEVTPQSGESTAFYSALASLARMPSAQLESAANKQLAQLATASIDPNSKDGKIQLAVQERAQAGYTSVVPLFLTPEKEVGAIVKLTGLARRAVRIAASEQAMSELNFGDSYYEMELFTPDSQNLPITCCVNQLPVGFPLGDQIREPVEVAGVFFKTWRYRTRELSAAGGQTASQRTSYTPVVLAPMPRRLPPIAESDSVWQLTAGIVFLVLLAGAWIYFSRQARGDRLLQRSEPQVDFSQWESKA